MHGNTTKKYSPWTYFTVSAILVSLDQGSKYFFHETTGAFLNQEGSFSLPLPPWMIIVSSVVIIAVLAHILFKPTTPATMTNGLIFILSGGASNITDRILYGYVQDIIAISSVRFNIADIYIIVGSFLLLIGVYQAESRSASYRKGNKLS